MIKNYSLDAMPLNTLTGVGITQSSKLAKIGLHTVQDILLHTPFRYENQTHLYQIKDLLPGVYTTVEGKVLNCNIIFGNRRIMTCQISDGSGVLNIRFFNFNTRIKNYFIVGKRVLVYGKIKCGKFGAEMIHPVILMNQNLSTLKRKLTLTPIYLTTEGVNLTTLYKLTEQALKLLNASTLTELLPTDLANVMVSLPNALRILHRPPSSLLPADLKSGRHPAQRRLILEELLAYNLSMLALRSCTQRFQAHSLVTRNEFKNKLLTSLPFKLTIALTRVVAEIEHDMALNLPMMRLLLGDVGSGKTLVTALAAALAIVHGKLVALMAPTELLVEQHINNLRNWFTPLGIEIGLLVGKQKGKARLVQQEAIANGLMKIVVGTHAVFQERILFKDLALAIIDEQHRFGVHQRLALWEKGSRLGIHPHLLIITATPIPRTLAMTTYANLDISVIDELPQGRIPVVTIAIPDTRRNEIIQRVLNICINEGRQAYWVCTCIKDSGLVATRAAETTWKELRLMLPKINIGLLHGRMKLAEKLAVMQSFKLGELHLLVTTTVIEAGIDIPNSSLIVIENSERLGLAQIHQLRGRVGRSMIASYCVLLYKSPLSTTAQIRMQVLRNSNDGFIIAQKDLEIRGPGDLLGIRLSGKIKFRAVDLLRDQDMILEAGRLAHRIHKHYPKQAAALIKRWMPKNGYHFHA